MAVELKDLKPKASKITIDGKNYELKPFTLSIRIWAEDYFKTPEQKSGIQELSNLLAGIEANPDAALDAACKTCFKLLVDKEDFGNVEKFIDKVGNYNNLMQMYKALCECIGLGNPELSLQEQEQLEIKK